MAKKSIRGICHICGIDGPLSEEHIPPKGAFNDQKMYVGKPANGMPGGPDDIVDRKTVDGGVRMYTLCGNCNNNTGGWYARAFIDWCHKGKNILERSGGKPELVYCYQIRPLRVLKQIATMFFSVVGPDFSKRVPDLVKFVLNKEERYLPPDFRFFAYYNVGTERDHLRYAAPIGILNIETREQSLFSEITFSPFGYVMVLSNTTPPDRRLVEISHFAHYSYDAVRDIELPFAVLPTHFRLAGDYRKTN